MFPILTKSKIDIEMICHHKSSIDKLPKHKNFHIIFHDKWNTWVVVHFQTPNSMSMNALCNQWSDMYYILYNRVYTTCFPQCSEWYLPVLVAKVFTFAFRNEIYFEKLVKYNCSYIGVTPYEALVELSSI